MRCRERGRGPAIAWAAVALTLVLAVPAQAAPNCEAPPGTSAIEQYCENLPEAGRDGAADARIRDRVGDSLAPSATAELQRSGPDGAALLNLPRGSGATGKGAVPPSAQRDREPPEGESDSPLAAISSVLGPGSATVGSVLLWILVGTALFFGVMGLRRRANRP